MSPSLGRTSVWKPGIWSLLPSRSTPPSCTASTAVTPGVWRISLATEWGRPAPSDCPVCPESMKNCPWNWLSMVWLTEAVADAAKIEKNAMRPTPIIRAAAVDAVRLGLRVAFCRASRPVTPLSRATGAPIRLLMGPAMTGPSTATPRNVTSAPPPTTAIPLSRLPNRPRNRAATPRASTSSPNTVRTSERAERSTLTSRRAAMGDTRDARMAGAMATTMVTPTPAMKATTTELMWITAPLAGMPRPRPLSRALSPMATRMPKTRPSTAEINPTTNASPITEPSTWPRLAPMARNRAIWRERWATMIEKVL